MGSIGKIVKGNARAYRKFYKGTYSELYALVFSMTRDRCLAREVVQNAYLMLWEQRVMIRPEKESFRSYLMLLAKYGVITECRRRITKEVARIHFEQIRLANEEDTRLAKMKNLVLLKALDSLSAKRREIMELARSISKGAEGLYIQKGGKTLCHGPSQIRKVKRNFSDGLRAKTGFSGP